MNLEEQFRHAQKCKKRNYGKLVQLQKRLFDDWALERFGEKGYKGIKMSYMAYLMNIEADGISNKELATKVHVTKQAMSKVVKELEKLELVMSETNEDDARMSMISLTDKGKRMVIEVVDRVTEKMKEYESVVGKKNFAQAMDTMFTIVEYEKEKSKNRKPRNGKLP